LLTRRWTSQKWKGIESGFGCFGVFTRAKEEEEAHDEHVGNCVRARGVESIAHVGGVEEDRDGDRFDPMWRGIPLTERLEESGEA